MDYTKAIPETPPTGLFEFLQRREGRFSCGVLAYRMVSREYANASLDSDDCVGDFRQNEKAKAALLWCSECGSEMVAEYIPGTACNGHGTPSGIHLQDDTERTSRAFQNGEKMRCPHCGEQVKLRSTSDIRYGYNEQVFVTAASVYEGMPVLTTYCVERSIYDRAQEIAISPSFAYIVDKQKVVKLVKCRRFMSRYCQLREWKQQQRLTDNMGAPYFFDRLPSLDGTCLENAKLWEYKNQAYESGNFLPLCYIRLYLRRPNVENLITAGMGKMLGKAMGKDAGVNSGYYKRPALPWISWNEARPAQMLGLTKEQLRVAKAKGWESDKLQFWQEHKHRMKFADAVELLEWTTAREAKKIMQAPVPAIKIVRYCRKQDRDYSYLADYWDMAVVAGMDLDQNEVRWPQNLRVAHDRAMAAQQCETSAEIRAAFKRLSIQCADLCWEHNGICIRPAASPEELVQEGGTLHHCVGGYAKTHAEGRIILFIRHARRPERSWFTLNVDLTTKCIIQNHGYRNEFAHGHALHIPKEVQEFVALWQEQVLNPWKMKPIEQKPKKKKTNPASRKKTAAA